MIPGVVAHLWQSTLFAGGAWLVVLALRTNRAEVRHWVWFTASAKFLIPFSLLAGLGTLIPHPGAAPARIEWVAALQEFSQPLTLSTAQVAATARAKDHGYFVAAMAALWACGFVGVAICWLRGWDRVRARRSSPHPLRVPRRL